MSTAKNFVDITEDYWARYAAQLIRLDRCLINCGAECDVIRGHLSGSYNISSTNMRHALSVMREPNTLDRSQSSAQTWDTA